MAGPDGLSSEFFTTLYDILAPLLLRMIINSKKDNALPDTLYEANISLILKKNKDETDPASYRPIALQNFDRKVVTKILAIRLNKHLPSVIQPDQTGFIPGRFSFFNVCCLLDTIYANHTKANKAVLGCAEGL